MLTFLNGLSAGYNDPVDVDECVVVYDEASVPAAFLPALIRCPEESAIEVLEFEAVDECRFSSGSLTSGGFEALNGDCG